MFIQALLSQGKIGTDDLTTGHPHVQRFFHEKLEATGAAGAGCKMLIINSGYFLNRDFISVIASEKRWLSFSIASVLAFWIRSPSSRVFETAFS